MTAAQTLAQAPETALRTLRRATATADANADADASATTDAATGDDGPIGDGTASDTIVQPIDAPPDRVVDERPVAAAVEQMNLADQ